MAKELGLKTLIEGVETELQREYLRSVGCGRLQGYLLGKPASFDDSRKMIVKGEYLPLERPEYHDFYEQVGHVNMLRPNPTTGIGGHYVPGDVPCAILRCRQGVYDYLNASDAYKDFLQLKQISGLEESSIRMNDASCMLHTRMREGIAESVESGDWADIDCKCDVQQCSFQVKCVADDRENDMMALLLIALETKTLA